MKFTLLSSREATYIIPASKGDKLEAELRAEKLPARLNLAGSFGFLLDNQTLCAMLE